MIDRSFRPTAALFLVPALLLAACGSSSDGEQSVSSESSPNLVIILLDTLRPDHLGCYGYERATSPNLDRFAAESVLFENALSVAPWTAPTMISMVTSVHPMVHGVNNHPNPKRMVETIPTLPEILSEHGYSTAAFTGGGYARGDYGLDRGFDTFEHQIHREGVSRLANEEGPDRLVSGVNQSIAWLEEHHSKPFFLLFHTYEPHSPYFAELEHLQAIQPAYDEEAEVAALLEAEAVWNSGGELTDAQGLVLLKHGYHCGLAEGEGTQRQQELFEELNARGLRMEDAFHPELQAFVNDLYDAEIRYADQEVQRLFDALEQLDVAQDTIVLVVSDHGEGFGQHGELGHGTNLHGAVLKIVMILRAPMRDDLVARVPEGVSIIDVTPTLLELMGITTDTRSFQGRSLLPEARGEGVDRPVFSSTRAIAAGSTRRQTVRTPRWRYIREDRSAERWLYDLEADPLETRNLVEERPEVARKLEELLLTQRRRERDLEASFGGEATAVELSEHMRAELNGLGYVGDE